MTKISQYDTVVLRESIGSFHEGEKGAVVEVYTTPYEAYDIEIVTDQGTTKGLLEGIRPEQIERFSPEDVESGRAQTAATETAAVMGEADLVGPNLMDTLVERPGMVSTGDNANNVYDENVLDSKIAVLIEELRKHDIEGKEELVKQLQDSGIKQDKAKLAAVAGKVIQTAAAIASIVSAAAALLG